MSVYSPLLLDGVQLATYSSGSGELPVVFQHGLCGDHMQIEAVFPQDVNCQLMTLECRGHGQSEAGKPEHLSISTFADDVIEMAARAGFSRFVMGGISMGAAISLRMTVKHPELVSGLILGRPAWVCEKAPGNMKYMAKIGALLSAMSGDDARAEFIALPEAVELSRISPDNYKGLLAFFDRKPRLVTSDLLTRISDDGPGVSKEELGQIKVPTLIVGTQEDVVHPMSYAAQLAKLIPNAMLVEITSKSHDLTAYTAEFQTVISSFLREFS
ncbi:MAG: alpha/beta hydrolase [Hyphomicrobiales bacterium]